MKQTQLAKQLKVSNACISQIVSGRRDASGKLAIKIGYATGTDPAIWIEGTPGQRIKALKSAAKSIKLVA